MRRAAAVDAVLHEPQQYDADSDRRCLACGHAVPHNYSEYEDTHVRCTHETPVKYGCGDHGMLKSGARKGEQRFSPKCAEEDASPAACFIGKKQCDCSEEDRLIADLRAHIASLNDAIQRSVLGAIS